MTGSDRPSAPSIADPYRDLLMNLDDGRRRGLVLRLAVGYYEGWRPTHTEMANLIAVETGLMTEEQYFASPAGLLPGADPEEMFASAQLAESAFRADST